MLFTFLFFKIFIKPRKKFITKNLVITHKLSTLKGFNYKEIFFAIIIMFFGFCYCPREMAKEEGKIKIKCIVSMKV